MSKYNSQKIIYSANNNKNELKEQNNILKERNNLIKENNSKDDRLIYTLTILDLNNLINLFNEKNITFIDLLLLSKESMKELQLEMYQRNRIYNFSILFTKFAKDYSMEEIKQFFESHKQFLFMPNKNNERKVNNNKNINQNINTNIKNIKTREIFIINDENKNEINYDTHRYNTNKLKKRKEYNSTNKKSYKGKHMLKKYLSIKRDVDEFLNKLNKQKEDTQVLTYKYGNFIKKLNFYERNEDDIMISEEKNINKKNNINNLLEKIKNLENKKIDQKTFDHINQIKNYLIEKEADITNEEIIKLQNEIEKMTELNIKKEKLKNNLELYEKKINEKKNLIIQLDNSDNYINNNKNFN